MCIIVYGRCLNVCTALFRSHTVFSCRIHSFHHKPRPTRTSHTFRMAQLLLCPLQVGRFSKRHEPHSFIIIIFIDASVCHSFFLTLFLGCQWILVDFEQINHSKRGLHAKQILAFFIVCDFPRKKFSTQCF